MVTKYHINRPYQQTGSRNKFCGNSHYTA